MNRAMNLLGALSIGAGLMYLLDPDRGEKRRNVARKQMKSSWKQARRNLNEISDDVADRAGRYATRGWEATEPMRGRLGDYGDVARKRIRKLAKKAAVKEMSNYASDLFDSGRELGNRAVERANDFREPVAEQAQELIEGIGKRVQKLIGNYAVTQRGTSPWIYALAGLGFGAGLMFIMDPSLGGRRRALVGERVTNVINSDTARNASQDIQSWARQLLVQVKTLLGKEAEEEIDERLKRFDDKSRQDMDQPGNAGW